jgi:hypothetical protein
MDTLTDAERSMLIEELAKRPRVVAFGNSGDWRQRTRLHRVDGSSGGARRHRPDLIS